MGAVLKITDERFGPAGAERTAAAELRLVSERVTPRQIIRQRVEAELERRDRMKAAHAATRSFLIDLEAASPEAILNRGAAPPRRSATTLATHVDAALEAFQKQRFILLFDDLQIDDLDQEVSVTPESKAVFLYLTPLKGG